MLAFPAGVAAYVVLLVLVLAVVERLRAPGALPSALIAHRILPRYAVRPVAFAVTAAEAVLAVGTLLSPVALVAAAVLFAGYGGYGWYVIATGHSGPCGCGGAEVPMDRWVVGRAFALTALAAFAAAAYDPVPFDERLLVTLLAAATIGTLLWHLPAAMHDRTRETA